MIVWVLVLLQSEFVENRLLCPPVISFCLRHIARGSILKEKVVKLGKIPISFKELWFLCVWLGRSCRYLKTDLNEIVSYLFMRIPQYKEKRPKSSLGVEAGLWLTFKFPCSHASASVTSYLGKVYGTANSHNGE